MFEFIGLFVGLVLLGVLAILLGAIFAGLAWLLFWGHRRPLLTIFALALLPLASVAWLIVCGIGFTIFVPNQPDVFFGDISEPLPNGYVLTGLGKMPEYSYLDRPVSAGPQPQLPGGIRSLEQDGPIIYGEYGHLNQQNDPLDIPTTHKTLYFAFDTRTGLFKDFVSLDALNTAAGHPVHLVASEVFRSQDPARRRLRRIEDILYFTPPCVAFLLCCAILLRARLRIPVARA